MDQWKSKCSKMFEHLMESPLRLQPRELYVRPEAPTMVRHFVWQQAFGLGLSCSEGIDHIPRRAYQEQNMRVKQFMLYREDTSSTTNFGNSPAILWPVGKDPDASRFEPTVHVKTAQRLVHECRRSFKYRHLQNLQTIFVESSGYSFLPVPLIHGASQW